MGTNLGHISRDDSELQVNNTSGYTGVSFYNNLNKWVASCSFQGYTARKYFKKVDDAIAARKKMKSIRDEFVEWYKSLSKEEKEKAIIEYNGNNDYFKKLFKDRMNNLF